MTIFRIYEQNGSSAGFWVQHRRWRNACARVHSVSGQLEGLSTTGVDIDLSRDTIVTMELFDVRSGRPVDYERVPPDDRRFTQIAEPEWYRRATERLERGAARGVRALKKPKKRVLHDNREIPCCLESSVGSSSD